MILWITAVAVAMGVGVIIGRLLGDRDDPALAERAHRSEAALEVAQQTVEDLRAERLVMRSNTTHLRDTFQALAAEALKGANDQFLAMAQGGLKSLVERSDGSLEQRQKAVADLVTPLREALTQ